MTYCIDCEIAAQVMYAAENILINAVIVNISRAGTREKKLLTTLFIQTINSY